MKFNKACPICSGNKFSYQEVLWPELIERWELNDHEVEYINRQQGLTCSVCKNNFRSMALSNAITHAYKYPDNLSTFVDASISKNLKILEINEAGGLSSTLQKISGHVLARYPEHDMSKLTYKDNSFDLVVHSDTLEHIPDPIKALSECHRVLARNGKCIFTVPIIIDRMSRSRSNLPPSYHGQSEVPAKDQLVFTEFGADIWQIVLESGFSSCEINSLEFPSGLAIIAGK